MTDPRHAAAPDCEAAEGGAQMAGGPLPIVPGTAPDVTDDIPTLAELSRRGRDISSAYYERGFVDGITAGRQQLEDEWRGTHEVSAAIARMIAQAGPYDELEERRGRPVRAAAHRRLMAERGI